MKYFKGVNIKDKTKLFENFMCESDFCIVGSGDGAQTALEYTSTCRDRIDKLRLISPVFDTDKSDKYKKLESIKKRGVEIEVYLDEKDKIISPLHVEEFFKEFATIYIKTEEICYE